MLNAFIFTAFFCLLNKMIDKSWKKKIKVSHKIKKAKFIISFYKIVAVSIFSVRMLTRVALRYNCEYLDYKPV